MLAMRDYQVSAVEASERAAGQGILRQMIVLPTGGGKTVIFAHIAKRRGGRTLVLAHRQELLDQAEAKFEVVWPEARIGRVQAEQDRFRGYDVVIASVPTLSREERLRRLAIEEFQTIVVDEAHHAAARTYRRVLEALRAGERSLLLGVTATPDRADGEPLRPTFEEIVYQVSLLQLIAAGYLADLRAKRVYTRVSLDGVPTRGQDLDERALASVLNTANRNELIAEAYMQYARGRKAILFAAGVDHAETLAHTFRAYGIAAAAVSDRTPPRRRRAILNDFRRGHIQVLTNCGILTEGYDEPSISCVILARPTKSRPLFSQMVGRGTRLFPGKRDCLILDFADNTTRHEISTLADLVGKRVAEEVEKGASLLEARARVLYGGEKVDSTLGVGHGLKAHDVELFSRSVFRWIVAGDRMRLPAGKGVGINLIPVAENRYEVWLDPREGEPRLLHEQALPIDYAQAVAEEYVRAHARALALKDAGWRQRDASTEQLHILKRLGITAPSKLKAGEASDLISDVVDRRALLRFRPPRLDKAL